MYSWIILNYVFDKLLFQGLGGNGGSFKPACAYIIFNHLINHLYKSYISNTIEFVWKLQAKIKILKHWE
jgi:hypothetical protein